MHGDCRHSETQLQYWGRFVEVINDSIYNHPRYYDLVFGADCAAETRFICDVNQKYLNNRATRLFEPACGTGRLMFSLAKRGFEVEGIDLNPKAIEFSNRRSDRHGYPQTAFVADMASFRAKRKWDLAFNTVNSFRHLTDTASTLSHLQCMAEQTKRGGIYLIGFHLTPQTVEPTDWESWSARRGNLSVITKMWTIDRSPRERLETFGMHFDIYTPTRLFRISDELRMRSYTSIQFASLIEKSGRWEIVGTYDFTYDINQPITIDPSSEDVVYILKKKQN